jgi:hypothetical protein
MKLTITNQEALTLIKKSLGLPLDTEIVIEDALPEPFKTLIEGIDSLDYEGSQKIAAIKFFRTHCPSSIAEAKRAVENWITVKSWIIKHKQLPTKFGDNEYNFNVGV